jgi:hypothetical protein
MVVPLRKRGAQMRHDCYLCKRPVGLIRKGICRPYRYEVIKGEEVPVCMNKRQCKLAESRKVEA